MSFRDVMDVLYFGLNCGILFLLLMLIRRMKP